jgi:hypothetical protein
VSRYVDPPPGRCSQTGCRELALPDHRVCHQHHVRLGPCGRCGYVRPEHRADSPPASLQGFQARGAVSWRFAGFLTPRQ